LSLSRCGLESVAQRPRTLVTPHDGRVSVLCKWKCFASGAVGWHRRCSGDPQPLRRAASTRVMGSARRINALRLDRSEDVRYWQHFRNTAMHDAMLARAIRIGRKVRKADSQAESQQAPPHPEEPASAQRMRASRRMGRTRKPRRIGRPRPSRRARSHPEPAEGRERSSA
jgi:hypothetical protein